jgi:glycosyltransferase involved in cell wall biosynthesis
MAGAVGAALHELHCGGGRLRRYWVLLRRTVRLVLRSRADVIFFQNPSIVLAVTVIAMKSLRLTRAAMVGDFHNAGVFPPIGKSWVPWLVKRCDLVIVSNTNLEARVTAMGGRCLALPDPLPDLPTGNGGRCRGGRFQVLMVCSWADDEPVAEVLRAAEILRTMAPGVRVAITGLPALAQRGWTARVPENVELTGYLSEEEFVRRLQCSDVIMDLTTREDCMVCGAYEAVSTGVPLIVSANEPTMRYFYKGSLFTDNSATDIARCVVEAIARQEVLRGDVRDLKGEILAKERQLIGSLVEAINLMTKARSAC